MLQSTRATHWSVDCDYSARCAEYLYNNAPFAVAGNDIVSVPANGRAYFHYFINVHKRSHEPLRSCSTNTLASILFQTPRPLSTMSSLKSYAYPGWGEWAQKNMSYSQAIRVGDRILCVLVKVSRCDSLPNGSLLTQFLLRRMGWQEQRRGLRKPDQKRSAGGDRSGF